MTGTLILDTSFIMHLVRFDAFCRTQQFRPPKTAEQLPLHGIEHLLGKGQTFVIPNEVLREMTYRESGKFGMGRSNGTLFLDPQRLQQCNADPFMHYLQGKYAAGAVELFDDPKEFIAMSQRGLLDGKICIVSQHAVGQGSGNQPHQPGRLHKSHGDREVLSLFASFSRGGLRPQVVLTIDKGLRERLIHSEGKGRVDGTMFYLKGLERTGFVRNSNTFPLLLEKYSAQIGADFRPPGAERFIKMEGMWDSMLPPTGRSAAG